MSGKIIAGLIIFVALVTFPFIYNVGKANTVPEPNLDTPVIKQMAVKQCIEPRQFMRAEHMQLLNNWRDSVVRSGNRMHTASDGKQYSMSLQNTCMNCHSNKKEFCDKCHNYMAVNPYCFDCHLQPKENKS